jgi:hypothetical protein
MRCDGHPACGDMSHPARSPSAIQHLGMKKPAVIAQGGREKKKPADEAGLERLDQDFKFPA